MAGRSKGWRSAFQPVEGVLVRGEAGKVIYIQPRDEEVYSLPRSQMDAGKGVSAVGDVGVMWVKGWYIQDSMVPGSTSHQPTFEVLQALCYPGKEPVPWKKKCSSVCVRPGDRPRRAEYVSRDWREEAMACIKANPDKWRLPEAERQRSFTDEDIGRDLDRAGLTLPGEGERQGRRAEGGRGEERGRAGEGRGSSSGGPRDPSVDYGAPPTSGSGVAPAAEAKQVSELAKRRVTAAEAEVEALRRLGDIALCLGVAWLARGDKSDVGQEMRQTATERLRTMMGVK